MIGGPTLPIRRSAGRDFEPQSLCMKSRAGESAIASPISSRRLLDAYEGEATGAGTIDSMKAPVRASMMTSAVVAGEGHGCGVAV